MRGSGLPSSPVTAASSRAAWLVEYAASRLQVSLRRLLGALQADFGMHRTCGSLSSAKVGDLGPPGTLPLSTAKARPTCPHLTLAATDTGGVRLHERSGQFGGRAAAQWPPLCGQPACSWAPHSWDAAGPGLPARTRDCLQRLMLQNAQQLAESPELAPSIERGATQKRWLLLSCASAAAAADTENFQRSPLLF